ncbi:MAG: hypothetical protein AAGA96_12800 [Verrucomicrobiota bacterium]
MELTRCCWILASSMVLGIASAGLAGDWGHQDPKVPVDYTPDSWELKVAPYGFLTALDGNLDVGNLSADFGGDFSDILQNLDFAAFVGTSAKKGAVSIYNDFLYAGLSPGGANRQGLYNQIDLEMDMLIWNGAVTYRFWDEKDFFLELGGGVRFMYLSTEISAHSAILRNRPLLAAATGLPAFANTSSVSHVWDGVGVVRLGYDFSDRWLIRAYGDFGGGDSDFTWQAMVNVGYVVCESATAFLGYRYLSYEFSQGIVSMDMSFSGPQLGVAIEF